MFVPWIHQCSRASIYTPLKFSSRDVLIRRNDILNIWMFFFNSWGQQKRHTLVHPGSWRKSNHHLQETSSGQTEGTVSDNREWHPPRDPWSLCPACHAHEKAGCHINGWNLWRCESYLLLPKQHAENQVSNSFFFFEDLFFEIFAILLSLLSKTGIDLSLKTCLHIFLYPAVS